MTPSDQQVRSAIAAQAAEWFVEHRSGPLDREAQIRFMTWLQTSPTHVQEYLGVAGFARDVAAVGDEPDYAFDALLARVRASTGNALGAWQPSPRSVTWLRVAPVWSLAAAIVLVVLAVIVWSARDGERFGLPRTYGTVRGQQSMQKLPDGSVL